MQSPEVSFRLKWFLCLVGGLDELNNLTLDKLGLSMREHTVYRTLHCFNNILYEERKAIMEGKLDFEQNKHTR